MVNKYSNTLENNRIEFFSFYVRGLLQRTKKYGNGYYPDDDPHLKNEILIYW